MESLFNNPNLIMSRVAMLDYARDIVEEFKDDPRVNTKEFYKECEEILQNMEPIPTIKTKNDLNKFLSTRIKKSEPNQLFKQLDKKGYITNSKGYVQPVNK